MLRRLLRPLVYALALTQMLSAPAVTAASAASSGAPSAEMPCHGEIAPSAAEDHCTCCPDGVDSTAGCLAQCIGASATPSAFVMAVDATRAERPLVPAVIASGNPADPPLNPPPIL
jgi:hypothetical protein